MCKKRCHSSLIFSGVLSKSMGQILRVSAVLHILVHLDNEPCTDVDVIRAAINFVEVSREK